MTTSDMSTAERSTADMTSAPPATTGIGEHLSPSDRQNRKDLQ